MTRLFAKWVAKRIVIHYMAEDLNASRWQKIRFWLTPRHKLAALYTNFLTQKYSAYMAVLDQNPKRN